MEPRVEIVTDAIDPAALVERTQTEACGAVVTFLGIVRASHAGRRVKALSYEAYPAMALEQMRAIATEAQVQFGPCEIAVVHRTGDLGLGEASVAVVVAAPHRTAAFAACEYAIGELKRRVEIWKKEHYVEGDAVWVDNRTDTPR